MEGGGEILNVILIFFISEFFAQLCESAQDPLDVKQEKIENIKKDKEEDITFIVYIKVQQVSNFREAKLSSYF